MTQIPAAIFNMRTSFVRVLSKVIKANIIPGLFWCVSIVNSKISKKTNYFDFFFFFLNLISFSEKLYFARSCHFIFDWLYPFLLFHSNIRHCKFHIAKVFIISKQKKENAFDNEIDVFSNSFFILFSFNLQNLFIVFLYLSFLQWMVLKDLSSYFFHRKFWSKSRTCYPREPVGDMQGLFCLRLLNVYGTS